MRSRLRTTMNLGAGSLLISVALLGAWWAGDRARRPERPRWSSDAFVPVRDVPEAEQRGRGRWVFAANLRCPHCMATLVRLHEAWRRNARPEALVALIVDAPRRPDARALRGVPPIPVWWDRAGVWRRRWRHRLYGELIGFDAAGGYLRTVAGQEALSLARQPVPQGCVPRHHEAGRR